MKFLRYYILLLFALVLLPVTYAQEVPYGINYQAVARDSYGNELTNQAIDIRFTVISSTPLGTVEYQEVHYDVSTSRYGVFSVVIGKGTPIMGVCEAFADIDWKSAPHYLRVEIKFSNEFLEMGTMQFLSVPYALYAQKSLEPGPIGPPGPEGPKGDKGDPGDPASDNQKLSFDGTNLSIDGADGGNTVNMGSLIQSLSLKGDTLSISRGNFVTFSKLDVSDADADPLNEIQDLRLEGNELRITKNDDPSLIDLSAYLDNTDAQELDFSPADSSLVISGGNSISLAALLRDTDTDEFNEIQDLAFNNADSSLVISNGNSISLATLLRDSDTDEFNEIQDLALDGHILTITMNGNASEIDLEPYLDNTDEQQLVYDPVTYELTITNGTEAVNLEGLKDDADADPGNELQTINLDNTDILTLSDDPTGKEISLADYLDNTDNQQLSYDSLNYELSVSDGNTIKIGSVIAFRVSTSSSYNLSDDVYVKVLFDNTTDPNNIPNSNYDPATGIFTAPSAGIYSISVTTNFGFSNAHIKIMKGSADYEKLLGPTNNSGTYNSTIICKLSEGDEVSVWLKQTNGFNLSGVSFSGIFSGYRIY